MVDVSESYPVEALLGSDPNTHQKGGQGLRGRKMAPDTDDAQSGSEPGVIPRDLDDVASVMGIPTEEYTPRVQHALQEMMMRFLHQREELEQARARVEFLSDVADRHSFLPLINRRAFLRELTRLLSRTGQMAASNTLIILHARNVDSIRRTYGHGAAEAALGKIADILRRYLRASDILGSLGGTDFGLILSLTGSNAAENKVRDLLDAIDRINFVWNDQAVPLEADIGNTIFARGQTVDEVLSEADRDLLARMAAHTTSQTMGENEAVTDND